jgi:hypothetical protein
MDSVELLVASITVAVAPLVVRLAKALFSYITKKNVTRVKIVIGGVALEFSVGHDSGQAVREITAAIEERVPSPSPPPQQVPK